ncbi:uncharacterized protein [Montipora foliosa]|uniref:uncharacterized protein isoform X1 n=1 Tax=Montipora foliosa TaxID=591990 RepID=UPI0035F1860C
MLGLDMENVRLKSNDKAHRRSAIFIQRRQERSLRLSGVIYGDSRQRKRKTGKQGVIYGDSRQRKRKTGKQEFHMAEGRPVNPSVLLKCKQEVQKGQLSEKNCKSLCVYYFLSFLFLCNKK